MSSLWRRRRRGRSHGAGKRDGLEGINPPCAELTVPTHFLCPISLELMNDPVSLATGITYDREHIDKWIDTGNATCPVTNQALRNFDQIPNHALRMMIQDWCVSYGVERIPTPRIPITSYDVSEVCSRILAASRARDGNKCQELVTKVKNSAKESERNKRCLVNNGIGAALAETFESFSAEINHANLLKEILCALAWSFPLGEEGVAKLKSSASLRCMARFINGEDLSSVLVLKELLVSGDDRDQGIIVDGLMEVEGIEETLFHMVKVPICPRATQACLVLIHHMIMRKNHRPIIALRFVEMGLVALLLDILVDGNKNICEKALGVLDDACSLEQGKESACKNALTIPLLVKKILRVSDRATEYSISSLWKVCLGGNEEAPIEALQFGAFQKLLVVLQLGSCSQTTKEKVTDLLKFLNVYTNKLDCFHSSMSKGRFHLQ